MQDALERAKQMAKAREGRVPVRPPVAPPVSRPAPPATIAVPLPAYAPNEERQTELPGFPVRPYDIEQCTQNRVLVPETRLAGNAHGAAAYRILRARLLQRVRNDNWTAVGLTSPGPSEGKSLTAINLAIGLAMMETGRTVVLVDLDMRRPSVHRYLGFRPEFGVSDFLLTGMPLQKIMVDIGVERLTVLPGCASFANSSEILSSARIVHLLNEIKKCFPSRLVIVDLPPVLVTDDVLVLAPHMNAFLMVVEEGRTHARDIRKSVDLLKDANLLGTVLNKTPEATSQYYGY